MPNRQDITDEKYITSDKIFHHFDRVASWQRGENVYPVTIEIHPTNKCNNKCEYCHYEKDSTSLSLTQFETILKKLNDISCTGITLSGGGEPTVNPDCTEFIKKIKSAGFDGALITNLNIFDKDLYVAIVENLEWCRVSIDTCFSQTYKNIRAVDKLNEVNKNLKTLISYKKLANSNTTIGAQIVVSKKNMREIDETVKFYANYGLDYIQIRPFEILQNNNLYTKDEYDLIMEQLNITKQYETKSYKIILSDKWDIINPYHKNTTHGFSFCHGYQFIGAIDAYGDFYACCHKVEEKDKGFCYGNVINEPIRTLMSRREKIIKKLDLNNCYLGCRGSNINRRLEGLLKKKEHANFL